MLRRIQRNRRFESLGINSFNGLKRCVQIINDTGNRFAKSGFWSMGLGGYDMGYQISFKNVPIFEVNYEYREFSVITNELSDSEINEICRILDCADFERED